MTVRLLITGGSGQVGSQLQSIPWPKGTELFAPSSAELNLSSVTSIERALQAFSPSAVINAGAWTKVDLAESQDVAAFQANTMGPAAIAAYCREHDIPLVHISTDYVFDGTNSGPYLEADLVSPLNVYGASKLGGELAVTASRARAVILRTSWVFGPNGQNFLRTMLRLGNEKDFLSIVSDQYGSPTHAKDLAECCQSVILRMISDQKAPTGIYHFTNSGSTSWAGFAEEIFRISGMNNGPSASVSPISSTDFPVSAKRPQNSRLDCHKIEATYGVARRSWQEATRETIEEIKLRSWN